MAALATATALGYTSAKNPREALLPPRSSALLEQFIRPPKHHLGLSPSLARVYNESVFQESRRATALCARVLYTALIGNSSADLQGDTLSVPPADSRGCAVAFVSTDAVSSAPTDGWRLIHISPGTEDTRVLARVPKLMPHLFFGEHVAGLVWLDTKIVLPSDVTLADIVQSTLSDCGASFAAMAHPVNPTRAIWDAVAALELHRSSVPEAFRAQIDKYSADAAFGAAEHDGRNRVIDSPLVVRDLRVRERAHAMANRSGVAVGRCRAARALDLLWWSSFFEDGADRDQLPFAYALRHGALQPCEDSLAPTQLAALQRSGGRAEVGCGVGCGQGFLHLFGHTKTCANGSDSTGILPGFASRPPSWICGMKWLRGADQTMAAEGCDSCGPAETAETAETA